MKLLITGANGFLGGELLKQIAEKYDSEIDHLYLLVRPSSLINLKNKVEDISPSFPVSLIAGDLTYEGIFTSDQDEAKIIDTVDTIFHGAASYDLNDSYSHAYNNNVMGTLHLLKLCRKIKNLQKIHYVSTIAVAGDYDGYFNEEDLDLEQNLTNNYAKTKFEAEKIFRNYKMDAKKIILRPGIVIADSKTGLNFKEDGPYYIFKSLERFDKNIFFKGLRPYLNIMTIPLPCNQKATLPLVAVDDLADFATQLLFTPIGDDRQISTYHVFDPNSPSIGSFLRKALEIFGIKKVNFDTQVPYFNKVLNFLDIPPSIADYLKMKVTYDQSNYQAIIEKPTTNGDLKNFWQGVEKTYLDQATPPEGR